jgi:hypothetical protein
MRLKRALSAWASVLTIIVLAMPGTPSSNTWPLHSSAISIFFQRFPLADDHPAHGFQDEIEFFRGLCLA